MKKIKIVNYNFHNQITDHVMVSFQNSFWNQDWTIFLLQNWQNMRYKQTRKQTKKQKLKISISTTRLPTTSES